MTVTKRRLRDLALAATILGFVLSGCRDEPLDIPSKSKPPEALGGEAAGGENSGGQDGTEPTGGTNGATGGSNPLGGKAGTGGMGGKAGMGGMGGMGGKPVLLNCGDGKPDEGEECDDGNKLSGDGCSSQCQSSCEACEKNVCQEYDEAFENRYDLCYQLPGLAEGGPAKGVARTELCRNLVDCVRETQCMRPLGELSFDIVTCYCAFETTPNECNDPGFVHGPCYREFQEASEQEGIGDDVTSLLSAQTIAIGGGGLLLSRCDGYVCRDECLPNLVPEGEVTTISASIGALRNMAGESALGNLVADAQRAAGMTDFALVKATAVEAGYDLAFAATPHRAADADGRVLWTELLTIQQGYFQGANPNTGSYLRTMTVTGQQVYDVIGEQLVAGGFHVSGLTYTWDAALPVASRVVEVRKDGVPLQKAATFTLTVDNGVALVALNSATNVVTTTIPPLRALVDYLKSLPKPVNPPTIGRITRLN